MSGKKGLQAKTKEYTHSMQVKEADCEGICMETNTDVPCIYALLDFNRERQSSSVSHMLKYFFQVLCFSVSALQAFFSWPSNTTIQA